MNKLTRTILLAGAAGASTLTGLALTSTASSAQTPPSTESSDAPSSAPADAPSPEDCQGREGRHQLNLETAADAIGIDVEDLRTALEGGSTLAQVAEANNVDPQTVIDALVADASTHLAQKVESGELTQEQADERLADVTARITDHVQNGRPAGDEDHDRRPPPPPADADPSADAS